MALKRNYVENIFSNCEKLKADDIPEPHFKDFISVPSLETIATVSITTTLIKQPDIRDTIINHWREFERLSAPSFGTSRRKNFVNLLKSVYDKLAFLPLPDLLKTKISGMVSPLLLQMVKWIRYDLKNIEHLDSICWSNEGIVDKINTLKYLVEKDEDISRYIGRYFRSACLFCSEETVFDLWNKISEKTKTKYLSNKDLYKNYQNHLLAYWIHYIKNKLSDLLKNMKIYDKKYIYNCKDSLNKNMFQLALFTNNLLAVKYFWNKLTCEEISSNLTDWVQFTATNVALSNRDGFRVNHEISGILYFLLSKMSNTIEQEKMLQKNSEVILNSLIFDWPWHRFILPIINVVWEQISEKFYFIFINNISLQINEHLYLQYLLIKLWSDSPMNFKRGFIQKVLLKSNTDLFCNLLILEIVITIKEILESANPEEQKQIVYSLVQSDMFFSVVHSDKLHVFDSLCADIFSQYDIKLIKKDIVHYHGNGLCKKWIEEGDWKKVHIFSNWAFGTPDSIKHFIRDTTKTEITFSLLKNRGNYELVNKFMSWCFRSEEEIHEFKIHFAKSKPDIVELGHKDWLAFEKFLDWCFDSINEVHDFKLYFLGSSQFYRTIFCHLVFVYNFAFIENLLKWCCDSNEDLKQTKVTLALSRTWLKLLQRFVKDYSSDWDNWELVKKLINLVSPLEKDVIIKLKENIQSNIDFDDFHAYRKNSSFKIKKEDLFRLLNDCSYNIDDSYHSTYDNKRVNYEKE